MRVCVAVAGKKNALIESNHKIGDSRATREAQRVRNTNLGRVHLRRLLRLRRAGKASRMKTTGRAKGTLWTIKGIRAINSLLSIGSLIYTPRVTI